MPARRKNYDYAVRLYDGGFSIAEVAGYYGISRQAMHKILGRRGVQFRSNLRYGEDNHFFRGGAIEKGDANDVLERAIEKGIVKRPDTCSWCGCGGVFVDGRSSIQGHHTDYNKPLDVVWLCQKCHHDAHKGQRPRGINE